MNRLNKIKYLTIIFTSSFILGYEFIRHNFLIYELPKHVDMVISSAIYLAMSFIYSHFIFSLIEKIENRRQQDEKEAKILFDNSIDGIFVFDHNLKITDMNNGAEILSGWSLNHVKDKLTIESLFSFDDYFSNKQELNLNTIGEKGIKIEETTLKKTDDTFIPVSVSLTLITNNDKTVGKIAAIVRDLSERTQMEDVIKGLYKEATQKQHEAEAMYRISQTMTSINDETSEQVTSSLNRVVIDISKLFDQLEVGLFLYNFAKGSFELTALTNPNIKDLLNEGFQQQVINNQLNSQNKYLSFIPLKNDDFVLGYLGIYNLYRINVTLHQKELMKNIVHNLSILLENNMLYQRMKDVAITEERARLSREMHDGLAQIISSVHLKIETLKATTKKHHFDACANCLLSIQAIDHLVNEAYTEVRQNLFSLRMPLLDNVPFISYLKSYIKQFGVMNSIFTDIRFHLSPSENELIILEKEKVHIIRIVQEALANIRRHSKASKIKVTLESDGLTYCTLTIRDNGIGFTTERKQQSISEHFGLNTMQERSKLLGGAIKIDSHQDIGTEIILSIPMEEDSYEENTSNGMR